MKCNTLRLAVLAIGLVSFGAAAQRGLAVPTVFFDRDDNTGFPYMASYANSLAKFNDFTSTLNSFGVDDIEIAAGSNPPLSFGATGITAQTQGVLAQFTGGAFSIGNQALLESDAAGSSQVNTMFTFNQYITAFGAYVIQGGDGANNNPTTFRLRNTITNTVVDDVVQQIGPSWGDGNIFFLGVHDTVPFDQVEIIESTDVADGMLYDNIVVGNPVPEPGSLVLMMLGGACALCRRTGFRRS